MRRINTETVVACMAHQQFVWYWAYKQFIRNTAAFVVFVVYVEPTTTLAPFDPATKCQEWFPSAISVGWPNNTETLEKLGRLLWKETRCQNVSYTHPAFNGHDHGVAQINQIHRAYVEQVFAGPMEESMSDPTLNLRFAYLLYSELEAKGACGWRPWSMC